MVNNRKRKLSIKSNNSNEPDQSNSNETDQSNSSSKVESKKLKLERLDPAQLPDVVYEEFLEKKSKAEIFNYAFQRLGYKKRPVARLNEWFDAYENSRSRMNGNIKSHCQDLIKLIYQTFNPSIPDLIKEQVAKNDINRCASFKNVCDRVGYTIEFPIESIFQRYDTNDETLKADIGNDQFDLIQKLTHEFVKEKNFLFKCKGNLSQCRYTFQLPHNNDHKTITIKDCFHDEEKTLTIKNALLKPHCDNIKFQLINDSFLLISGKISSYTVNYSILQLAKFDLESEVCEVVDDKVVLMDQYKIVMDPKNSSKFMVISSKSIDSPFVVVCGDLKTGKFTAKHNFSFKNQANLMCIRLIDNKLSGLKFNHNGNNNWNQIAYWECVLDLSGEEELEAKEVFKFDCENLNFAYSNLSVFTDNYVWANDVCYMSLTNQSYGNNLYAFNMEFQKCILINYSDGFHFNNLYLRDDNCLICQESSGAYCFTLNKPQKMEYATWFSLRKKSEKEGKTELYENAKRKLPLNSQLRPFHIKNHSN